MDSSTDETNTLPVQISMDSSTDETNTLPVRVVSIGSRLSEAGDEGEKSVSALPFPWKLHEVLEEAELEGYTSIISWLPGNAGFRVHKPKEFVEKIMPRHFRQTKWKSFLRQLNLYDFERFQTEPFKGGYAHPSFTREKKDLCRYMKRTKLKRNSFPCQSRPLSEISCHDLKSDSSISSSQGTASSEDHLFDDETLFSVLPSLFHVQDAFEL